MTLSRTIEFNDIDGNHVGIDINGLNSRCVRASRQQLHISAVAYCILRKEEVLRVVGDWGSGKYRPSEVSKYKELYIGHQGFFRQREVESYLRVVDPTLGEDYVVEEVELVLKLGLMCSLLEPTFRPSMRQVVMYLEGSIAPPELSSLSLSTAGLTIAHGQGFDDFVVSLSSSSGIKTCSRCSLSTDSILSGGR
nr:L-type lectin-domain containing receptor kinase IV.1-like [Ipomoea batatas]